MKALLHAVGDETVAVRLGMLGLAFANADGVVTATDGELSRWLTAGEPLAANVLLGMDELLDALKDNPGERLTLPNLSFSEGLDSRYITIVVQWDPTTDQYVISTTELDAANNAEFDNLRALREQLYLREQLERERAHFRAIYESSPHLALSFDQQGQLIAASNELRAQFIGDHPAGGHLCKSLVGSDLWLRALAGEPVRKELIKATADSGESRSLEVSATRVDPPDGGLAEVYFSLNDVTERERYRLELTEHSDRLEAAAAQLREANHRLSRFAAVAAHDLLAPLRRIGTFSQMLSEEFEGPMSESLAFSLQAIQHSAERGQQLVDDVMNLTRAANHRPELRAVHPAELLREVARDSDLALAEAGASLRCSGERLAVMGDPGMLRLIFRNLLGNAIKFRDPDRALVISLDATDSGVGQIRLVFSDTGAGFAPEMAERIFEPFTRLDGDARTEGTGLGLAIVREAASSMNMRVSAWSAPGTGTRFQILANAAPNA